MGCSGLVSRKPWSSSRKIRDHASLDVRHPDSKPDGHRTQPWSTRRSHVLGHPWINVASHHWRRATANSVMKANRPPTFWNQITWGNIIFLILLKIFIPIFRIGWMVATHSNYLEKGCLISNQTSTYREKRRPSHSARLSSSDVLTAWHPCQTRSAPSITRRIFIAFWFHERKYFLKRFLHPYRKRLSVFTWVYLATCWYRAMIPEVIKEGKATYGHWGGWRSTTRTATRMYLHAAWTIQHGEPASSKVTFNEFEKSVW